MIKQGTLFDRQPVIKLIVLLFDFTVKGKTIYENENENHASGIDYKTHSNSNRILFGIFFFSLQRKDISK